MLQRGGGVRWRHLGKGAARRSRREAGRQKDKAESLVVRAGGGLHQEAEVEAGKLDEEEEEATEPDQDLLQWKP